VPFESGDVVGSFCSPFF